MSTETNPLLDAPAFHDAVDYSRTYSLREISDNKGRIIRLRLLSDYMPGRGTVYDVSYVIAKLPGGRLVPVQCLMDNLIPRYRLKNKIIAWAKEEHVYALGLGLLDESNWSIL